MDAATATDAEFNAMWNRLVFGGDVWYQSVVTTSRFEKGQLAEIRLHPVDLSYTARGADRGVPRLASAEVGRTILERLQRLSQPFGTRIAIEGRRRHHTSVRATRHCTDADCGRGLRIADSDSSIADSIAMIGSQSLDKFAIRSPNPQF